MIVCAKKTWVFPPPKTLGIPDKQQAMASSQKTHHKKQECFPLLKNNSEMSWTMGTPWEEIFTEVNSWISMFTISNMYI